MGDVLVQEDNLFGDGVNVASRLESIAPPGRICISGSVYSLVSNTDQINSINSNLHFIEAEKSPYDVSAEKIKSLI